MNIFYYFIPCTNLAVIAIINLVCFMALIHFSGFSMAYTHMALTFFVILVFLIFVLITIAVLKRKNKKMAEALVEGGEYKKMLSCENFGEAKPKTFNFLSYVKENPIKIPAVIIPFISVIIMIFCLSAFIPPDPFKRSSIEKIDVGDHSGYVYRVLGEPYDRSESTVFKGERDGVNGTWTWCSSGVAKQIAKKTKQLEKLTEAEDFSEAALKKIGKLTEQIFELELELSMTECDYVTVNFVDGKVTGAEFKNNYLEAKPKETYVSRITYSTPGSLGYYQIPSCWEDVHKFNARIYLSDGSLVLKTVMPLSPVNSVNPEYKWSDEYGEHIFKAIFG